MIKCNVLYSLDWRVLIIILLSVVRCSAQHIFSQIRNNNNLEKPSCMPGIYWHTQWTIDRSDRFHWLRFIIISTVIDWWTVSKLSIVPRYWNESRLVRGTQSRTPIDHIDCYWWQTQSTLALKITCRMWSIDTFDSTMIITIQYCS